MAYMSLDRQTRNAIVDFLDDYLDSDQRRALVESAFFGTNIPASLDYNGSNRVFADRLVNKLLRYGSDESGEPVLAVFLNVMKAHVGDDKQAELDTFTDAIREAGSKSGTVKSTNSRGPNAVGWIIRIGGGTLAFLATIATIFAALPEPTQNRVYVAVGLLEPTPTPSPTLVVTNTLTATHTATATASPTPTNTITPEPTSTPTAITVPPTDTPTVTASPTLSVTPTATQTQTETPTATSTQTPTPSFTSTQVEATPSPTATIFFQPVPTSAQILPCDAVIDSNAASTILNIVRQFPNPNATITGSVRRGEPIRVLEKSAGTDAFYEIQVNGRSVGWVAEEHIEFSANCST